MKCPHCSVAFHDSWTEVKIVGSANTITTRRSGWSALWQICPECRRAIIRLCELCSGGGTPRSQNEFLAYPQGNVRPVPPEVGDPYRKDFAEACAVLPLSGAASAALSRRCLQSILRDKAGTKSRDLYDQIEEAIGAGHLPSHIAEGLHAVRNIGNFAVHPMKSTSSGTILDVEPGEAEWNLDVIESLFDFYFVQPALATKRKTELNRKLKDAGKPEIA